MSPMQILTVCIAALSIPIWRKPATVRPVQPRRRSAYSPAMIRSGIIAAGIGLSAFNYAAAQEAASSPDSQSAASSEGHVEPAHHSPLDPNSIMGFEVPDAWLVRVDGFFPDFDVKSTTTRTQGSAAFAVSDPPSLMTLTSRRVGSTATALTGIGNRGALLQLDVQLPSQTDQSGRGNQGGCDPRSGEIEGFLSVRSAGLNRVSLGRLSLSKLRDGIYNTVSFTIPDSVSSRLNGATYDDMIFEFEVSAPGKVRGAYLFDNLRVHSVELTQSPTGEAPPSGYGGSVDLVVPGGPPVTQTFSLGPAQIPSGFHLKKGTAGGTTVQLELGLDSIPQLTCTYVPDTTDKTAESYIFKSCTGGYVAGDLVNANWVSLAILSATVGPAASRPTVGQSSWQHQRHRFDSAYAHLLGRLQHLRTHASSRQSRHNLDQLQEPDRAGQPDRHAILRDQWPPQNLMVTGWWLPSRFGGLRSGDGSPFKVSTKPEVAANNLPFQTGGDLNPGGSFDAYWKLSGNLTPPAVAGTDENLTHFDAAFTAHGVLFGDDIDVVDAKVTADTDSGETTPAYKPATSTGTLGFYVFGEEIPSGGLNLQSQHRLQRRSLLEPGVRSAFHPDLDLRYHAGRAGRCRPEGPGLGRALRRRPERGSQCVSRRARQRRHQPRRRQGKWMPKVNLITLSAPTTAQVKWVINNDPSGLRNHAQRLAQQQPQPWLRRRRGRSRRIRGRLPHLLHALLDAVQVELAGQQVLDPVRRHHRRAVVRVAHIAVPVHDQGEYRLTHGGASLSSGLPITLVGSAGPTDDTIASTSTYNWTYTPGANAGTVHGQPSWSQNGPNPGCHLWPSNFGQHLHMDHRPDRHHDRQGSGRFREHGDLDGDTGYRHCHQPQPGRVHRAEIVSGPNGPAVPDSDRRRSLQHRQRALARHGFRSRLRRHRHAELHIHRGVLQRSNRGMHPAPSLPMSLPVTGAATTTPSAVWSSGFQGGYYKITMTTTAGGTNFGTASAIVYGYVLV
jgi:hypothetical protein